jgi:hypothetical protein
MRSPVHAAICNDTTFRSNDDSVAKFTPKAARALASYPVFSRNDQQASTVEKTSTNAVIVFAEMPCFDFRFELQRIACGASGAILDPTFVA